MFECVLGHGFTINVDSQACTVRDVAEAIVYVDRAMSNYALRVPESLFAYARKVAEEEQVSMNQFFFVTAIAEKVSALKTETYFRERQARGDLAGFDVWLTASPDGPPMPGDELPTTTE